MKIVLINPAYPYGKHQIYFGGSISTLGAELLALGHTVTLIDLNIETLENVWETLSKSDFIGISVVGSPYIPGTVELCNKLTPLLKQIVVGGQVIAKLGEREFKVLFGEKVMREMPFHIGGGLTHSLVPIWKGMPSWKLKAYLEKEMTLVISQGCHFGCRFCAAEKGKVEQFKPSEILREELCYLAKKAKEFDLKKIEFYTTSLDFFQNPKEVEDRLRVAAEVSEETGVMFKIRCLSCMSSFLKAREIIPNFKKLTSRAGLWCIGFGVDGLNTETWREQKKSQNRNLNQVWRSIEAAQEAEIIPETLLVMGFRSEHPLLIIKYLLFAFLVTFKYRKVTLRPYVAKPQVPGNDDWGNDDPTREFVREPKKFSNLDFCALGSKQTHPNFWFRWSVNTVYILICGIFGPLGKCATSPLMPIGKSRWWNCFAQLWNQLVPFDR